MTPPRAAGERVLVVAIQAVWIGAHLFIAAGAAVASGVAAFAWREGSPSVAFWLVFGATALVRPVWREAKASPSAFGVGIPRTDRR